MSEDKVYRRDIDALRALAILVVLFFHLGFTTFNGGFIGVDIFFVISGFLITGIIKSSLEKGTFSFATFYENRIRRILPVLVFIVFCTMVAFYFVYFGRTEMRPLQSSIKRVMLAMPNIYFYLNTGYFDPSAQTMPLLHTWSLGVEEQFYFLFPLFMWLCYKYTNRKTLRYTVLITVCSFAASSILVFYSQKFTFFMLPTRAWELLFGAILALTMYTPESQKNKRILIYIGLLCMLVPVFTYDTLFFFPFPGLMALAPCIGATLYLSGGINLSEDSCITKFLKYKFFVFIGLISYSLYLWHWPLIILYKSFYLVTKLSTIEAFALLGVSILLSYLSWKFIENPFRKKMVFRKRKVLYPLALSGMALCLIPALSITSPFASGTFYLDDNEFTRKPSPITYQQMWERESNDFAFIGDSHASMWLGVVDNLSKEYGLNYLDSSVTPQNTIIQKYRFADPNDMSRWENFTKLVRKQSIHTVFWSFRWAFQVKGHDENQKFANREMIYENGNKKLSFAPALLEGLRDAVKTLLSLGVRDIYIMNTIPEPSFDVPPAASKLKHRGFSLDEINRHIGESLSAYNARTKAVQEVFTQLAAEFPAVHIIDIGPLLFDQEAQLYNAVTDEISYYGDDDHLSVAGAEALKEVFFPAFRKMKQYKIEQEHNARQ